MYARVRKNLKWLRRVLSRKSSLAKLRLNTLAARDVYPLTKRERIEVHAMLVSQRTLRVPASTFKYKMVGRRPTSNLVSFDRDQITRLPLMELDTFLFIDEIVRQGKAYRDTALFAARFSGAMKKLVRRELDNPESRVRIGSDEEFRKYYERCMALADSIAKHGVLDMRAADIAAQANDFGTDLNMLVAIDEDGELIHWRMGKHRLAIALALDVKDVPVNVGFLSGQWMLKSAGRPRVLTQSGLLTAISLAMEEAEKRAHSLARSVQ